jgi:N6-adenosine-specific RNA methylase IME4
MRYKKDMQYNPKKDGSGKATIKYTVTVTTDTLYESMQALQALGFDIAYTDVAFKKTLGEGTKTISPRIPLFNQT